MKETKILIPNDFYEREIKLNCCICSDELVKAIEDGVIDKGHYELKGGIHLYMPLNYANFINQFICDWIYISEISETHIPSIYYSYDGKTDLIVKGYMDDKMNTTYYPVYELIKENSQTGDMIYLLCITEWR